MAFLINMDTALTQVYSRLYFGGQFQTWVTDLQLDSSNQPIVVGITTTLASDSYRFPTTTNAYIQSSSLSVTDERRDGFVAQWNATGDTLRYSTLIGSDAFDTSLMGVGVGQDTSDKDDIYITGYTAGGSTGTTTAITPPHVADKAWHTTYSGTFSGIVMRLNPRATGLNSVQYGSLLGNSAAVWSSGIASKDGVAYLTGETQDATILENPLQPYGSTSALFVAALDTRQKAMPFSTYLGTNSRGTRILFDAQERLFVVGTTGPMYGTDILLAQLRPTALSLSITDANGQPVQGLTTNADGWPMLNADGSGALANPLTITATYVNPRATGISYGLNMNFTSATTKAHIYTSAPQNIECSWSGDAHGSNYSYTSFANRCALDEMQPAEARAVTWQVWVQPSEQTQLDIRATITPITSNVSLAQTSSLVTIPQAAIRPIVVVPGFVASWPRTEGPVTHNYDGMALDPIADTYEGLLTELLVLGYEPNLTLVPFPYKWYGGIKVPNEKNNIVQLGAKLRTRIDTWWDDKQRPTYVEAARFDLISHSTGGIITRQYVADTGSANKLENVILVAAPHLGSPMAYAAWEGQVLVHGSALQETPPGVILRIFLEALAAKSGCVDYATDAGPFSDVTDKGLYAYMHGWPCQIKIDGTPVGAPIFQPGMPLTADLLPQYNALVNNPYLVYMDTNAPFDFQRTPFSPVLSTTGNIGTSQALIDFVNNIVDNDGVLFTIYSTNIKSLKAYKIREDLQISPLWVGGQAIPGLPGSRPDSLDSDSVKGLEYSTGSDFGGDGSVPQWSGDLRRVIPETEPSVRMKIRSLAFPQEGLGYTDAIEVTHNDFFNKEISMRRIAARLVSGRSITDDITLSNELAPRLPYVVPNLPSQTDQVTNAAYQELIMLSLCPVTMLVTDPQGRRIGSLPDGSMVNEIPGGYYSGHKGDPNPDIIRFVRPLTGTYSFTITGVELGTFSISGMVARASSMDRLGYFTGSLQPGEVVTYTATLRDASVPRSTLLVHDGFYSHAERAFVDALTALGHIPTIWNIAQQGEPTSSDIFPYGAVIWLPSETNGLTIEQARLLRWSVHQGGQVLLAGQNAIDSLQATTILTDMLDIELLQATTTSRQLQGQGPLQDLHVTLNGNESLTPQTAPNVLAPFITSRTLATYTDGDGVNLAAIVGQEHGLGRQIILGFGLEGVDQEAARTVLLERLLAWLEHGDAPTPSNTFPTTPVLDDFNRPNGLPGKLWADRPDVYTIDNQALRSMSGSNVETIIWGPTFGADQEVYTTIADEPSGYFGMDLVLKSDERDDGMNLIDIAYVSRDERVEIWSVQHNGAWTKHGDDIPVTYHQGDQFGARATGGGTVTVYKNGVAIGSANLSGSWDATIEGGRVGVLMAPAPAYRVDDIGGGNVGGAQPPVPTPAFPATPLRDDFNRADGPVGNGWQGSPALYAIESNTVKSLSTTNTDYLYWPEAFGSTQEAYMTIRAMDAGHPYLSLLLKDTPSDLTQNGYNHRFVQVLYRPGGKALEIRTIDTCSVNVPCTQTQHGRTIPIFLSPGDQLGARASADGTVQVFKNGQLAGSAVIDPAWTPRSGGGRIGVHLVNAPVTRLDAVGGGTLP